MYDALFSCIHFLAMLKVRYVKLPSDELLLQNNLLQFCTLKN